MKHTNTVIQFQGSENQRAQACGDLYYDALARHQQLLSQKMARDSVADAGRGRHQLAGELQACADHFAEAVDKKGEKLPRFSCQG